MGVRNVRCGRLKPLCHPPLHGQCWQNIGLIIDKMFCKFTFNALENHGKFLEFLDTRSVHLVQFLLCNMCNAHFKVNPGPQVTLDFNMGLSNSTGDSDNSNSFRDCDITNGRNIDRLGRVSDRTFMAGWEFWQKHFLC